MYRAAILGLSFLVLSGSAFAQEKNSQKKRPQKKQRVPENVTAHRNIAYIENGHERQKLDIFVPKDASKPLPLLVWIHGGAWLGGSKDGCPLTPHTSRGYIVASLGYRLSQHAKFPAQLDDCQAAIRWLKKNASKYSIDPNRIGIAGASAGGHLVAMVGLAGTKTKGTDKDASVSAVVDFFGPSNFLTIAAQSKADSKIDHADANSPEARLIGGKISENEDLAKKASPVNFVSKDAPPFMILHGEADDVVPADQSTELHEALKKAGVKSDLYIIKGAGHGPGVMTPEYNRKVSEFFDKHLKSEK